MSKSYIEEYTKSNPCDPVPGTSSYTLKTGRAYIHDKCQQVTVVSGSDFAWLADPFRDAPGTMCCHCGPDDLKRFIWEDTREDLESYRRRLWDQTPKSQIWLYFAIIPGICFGVFFFLGKLLPPIGQLTPVAVQIIGAILAALVAYFVGLQVVVAGRQRPFYTEP